jgi:hypothetical protein
MRGLPKTAKALGIGLCEATVNGSSARSGIVTLSGVFGVAKPLWGYPLDYVAIRGAAKALRKMGTIKSSGHRDPRPSREPLSLSDQLGLIPFD